VRIVREEIKNVFVVGLLLFTVLFAITFNYCMSMQPLQQQQLQPTQKVKRLSTSYQELLLQFDDETESMKCLYWINNTPSKQLRSTLRKAKIYNNRIDILLSHRPYTSWNEVFYLPQIGIKTIEKLVTTWRGVK
jgi:hypothetical protein